MIIRFHNLGAIKETEIDLRPLTVIIGPNNTNKTYIAYTLYGLWSAFRAWRPYLAFQSRFLDDDGIALPINDSFFDTMAANIHLIVHEFEETLGTFYQDSSGKMFSGTRIELLPISRDLIDEAIRSFADDKLIQNKLECRVELSDDEIHLIPFQTNGSARRVGVSAHLLPTFLIGYVFGLIFSAPCLLPVERNAFIISYKVLAKGRLKLLLEQQRMLLGRHDLDKRQLDILRESGEIRYPKPIEDFLEFLTDVELEGDSGRRMEEGTLGGFVANKRLDIIRQFKTLATTIENTIQDKAKTKYRKTALGGRELVVSVPGGQEIDIYNASSSIKQLAPLLLYLRHRAVRNDILFIDEPEMNLHPESQAKLLEVLAILVNKGVNVFLTTHSPYLLAHLNNLVLGDQVPESNRAKQAKSLYLRDPEALLNMDQVSAYEMKDNKLQSLKDPDYGIRWDTLSDVASDIQQKFFEIYEKGHAKPRETRAKKN